MRQTFNSVSYAVEFGYAGRQIPLSTSLTSVMYVVKFLHTPLNVINKLPLKNCFFEIQAALYARSTND